MLEKKDLEAIDEMIQKRIGESEARTNARFEAVDKRFEAMDKRFEDMEARMDKRFEDFEARMDKRFEEMEQRINKNVLIMMETEFSRRFDLLAENQQMILEKLVSPARVEKVEEDVQVLKTAVRHLSGEVRELKAAK